MIAAIVILALVVAAVAAWLIFVRSSRPAAPGAFYSAPSPLPEGPSGTIIRRGVVEGFHAGATAYRVLYKSTGFDGNPAAVSGLIVLPHGKPPAEGRKVIAYTHGTVGVASNCAPSLVTNPKQQPLLFEGGAELLFAVNIETTVGKVLIAMALQSWESVYGDAELDQIVTPAAQPAVARIARHCLYNREQILASVPSALVLGLTFLHTPPWEADPWKTILVQNTPRRLHGPELRSFSHKALPTRSSRRT